MDKLTITSGRLLKIGQVYQGLVDQQGIARPEQEFLVVRKSTREEWVDCMISFGENQELVALLSFADPYFYEIQTD